MDTTLQCSPRSGPQGAEPLAGAIVEAMPVVVAHQLRTLGAHQRRHALRDDFTLGYLFGLLYGLSRQLPEAARERFLLSVAAPTFSVVYDGDGTAIARRARGAEPADAGRLACRRPGCPQLDVGRGAHHAPRDRVLHAAPRRRRRALRAGRRLRTGGALTPPPASRLSTTEKEA